MTGLQITTSLRQKEFLGDYGPCDPRFPQLEEFWQTAEPDEMAGTQI